MRKLVIIVALLTIGALAFAQDALRGHYYTDADNFGTPLYLPDGTTPIPYGCFYEFVLCVNQTTAVEGSQSLDNDIPSSAWNREPGVPLEAYIGTIGYGLEGNDPPLDNGYFIHPADQKFSDPLGAPAEPCLTCGDKYYVRIWDAPTKAAATHYRTSAIMTGPAVASTGSIEVTPWNAWVSVITIDPNPTLATTPAPINGATGVSINANLGWDYVVDAGYTNPVKFKVFFGTTATPTVQVGTVNYANGTVTYAYDLPTLEYNTQYYWMIVPTTTARGEVRDARKIEAGRGDAVGALIWNFTTEANPVSPNPTVATLPVPGNGATGVSVMADLGWSYVVDPLFTNPSKFKVYFGTDATPTTMVGEVLYANGTVVYGYTLPQLDYNTQYYWMVVPTTDVRGETRNVQKQAMNRADATGAAVWSFTTETGNITGGGVPTDLNPGDGNNITIDPPDGAPAGQIDVTIIPAPLPLPTGAGEGGFGLYYQIESTTWTTFPIDLTFEWNAPAPNPTDTPIMWTDNGSGWEKFVPAQPSDLTYNFTTAPYWIKVRVPHFSGWAPGYGPTVPVEFTAFSAVYAANDGCVNLNWTTASETDMQGYKVWRSEDSSLDHAAQVSDLISATNTSTTHNYNFQDTAIQVGKTYKYWVEAVELNGHITYHESAPVVIQGNPVVPFDQMTALGNAYPNPFNPLTHINLSVKQGDKATVVVYNMLGQVVKNFGTFTATQNGQILSWDGTDDNGRAVCSGIYFFKLNSNTTVDVKKVMMMK